MFVVRFTAERVTDESAELGAPFENGWVDHDWSRWEFSEEIPEGTEFDTKEEAINFIDSEIGPAFTDDDVTWYAEDCDVDYQSGDWWMRAAHITEEGGA